MQFFKILSLITGSALGVFLSAAIVAAWTGPSASPPSGNVGAPINVGATSQIKSGDLGVSNLTTFGNTLLSGLGVGTGRYLNFDYTNAGSIGGGSGGYGIRDNAGTLEFKNNGGSWQSLQTVVSGLVGSGQWTTSGANIYNSNSGNVGIGMIVPTNDLAIQQKTDTQSTGGLRLYDHAKDDGGTVLLQGADHNTYLFNMGGGVSGNGMKFYVNGSVNAMNITSDGSVGINVTPSFPLQVNGKAGNWTQVMNWPPGSVNAYGILVGTGAGKYSQFQNAEGYYTMLANSSWGVYTNGNVGAAAFLYVSDKRLKNNVQPLQKGLLDLLKLRPVSFTWNEKDPLGRKGQSDVGFIAQEVESIYPEAVQTDAKTGYKEIDYPRLVPLMVQAVQDQEKKIDAQQKEIDELKAAIADLKK
jgi:hypothetical protein